MTVVVSGAVKRCRWKFAQSQQSRIELGLCLNDRF
jgi:hypothetical protein